MPELPQGMSTDQRLSHIFGLLKRGELALPELQRPSVWGNSKIPLLLESVYKDYPFGIMLVWTPRAGSRIICRNFVFEERSTDEPREAEHYLIDGQQRLTSFYRSLHDDAALPQARDWKVDVAFNVIDEEFSLIDGKIKSMLENPREHGWYRLRQLLKSGAAELTRVRTEQQKVDDDKPYLDDEEFEAIFGQGGRLRRLLPENIAVGIYNIHERSYGEVVEIFERINDGTPVPQSQIILGKLSEFYPGIVGDVEGYLAERRVKHGRGFDLDFFMLTLSVLVRRGWAQIGPLPGEYKQEDPEEKLAAIRADVARTKEAIDRALRFMDDRLWMDTLKYIRSQTTIACLAYLLEKFRDCRVEGAEGYRVAFWVAQALLIGYHDDQARFKQDVAAIRDSEKVPLDDFRKNLRRLSVKGEIQSVKDQLDDADYAILRGDKLFSFVYAMLRWKGAVSFPSKRPIQAIRVDDTHDDDSDTDRQLTLSPVLQEHHIYPAARLRDELEAGEDEWLTKRFINDIANITLIFGDDNFGIGDSAIEYLDEIDVEIRAQHMISPKHYLTGSYQAFLTDRRKFIKERLAEYMGFLESRCEPSK